MYYRESEKPCGCHVNATSHEEGQEYRTWTVYCEEHEKEAREREGSM